MRFLDTKKFCVDKRLFCSRVKNEFACVASNGRFDQKQALLPNWNG